MVLLITFRAVQGLGGGALTVTSTALIADVIPLRLRGQWVQDKKFGKQFKVSTYQLESPKTANSIREVRVGRHILLKLREHQLQCGGGRGIW